MFAKCVWTEYSDKKKKLCVSRLNRKSVCLKPPRKKTRKKL